MEIRFLEIAERELDEAVTYYNAESPGLGDQFLLQILNALERIRQYSESWQRFSQNTRRCRVVLPARGERARAGGHKPA